MPKTKRKPMRETFELNDIRKALRKWVGIWIANEDFPVSWHNFKYDLRDIKQRKRVKGAKR